jgi:hypothetical protein
VWAFPDWARANPDRTFGNRYDDCEGLYRVLYAASKAYGSYVETLARFRPDLHFYAELADIGGDIDHAIPGVVDRNWRERRRLGTATIDGKHEDVGTSDWLAAFRRHLAKEALAAGFEDFDAHALYATAPRSLTQHISRMVLDNGCDGIRYLSKFGLESECWAFFETRISIRDSEELEIKADDSELESAKKLHGLAFSDDAV